MVEHMEDCRGQGERCRRPKATRLEGERQAQPDEDDSDVLNRVIRKQALQVVLHQRIQDTEECCDTGDDEHRNAPPP
jgi:hypothetical protein